MIDEGSGADAGNFSQFEPVLDAAGRITALRFVFPPYQVGPYPDGVQVAAVPASTLLPYVAEPYRDRFSVPGAYARTGWPPNCDPTAVLVTWARAFRVPHREAWTRLHNSANALPPC